MEFIWFCLISIMIALYVVLDGFDLGAGILFTLLGFMGMYLVLGILFLFMVHREIEHGPAPALRG